MSESNQDKVPVIDSNGNYLIATEETENGTIFYFQTEEDIKKLIARLEELKCTEIPTEQELLLSSCFRSAHGFCMGSCTAEAAICIEEGIPPVSFCTCK